MLAVLSVQNRTNMRYNAHSRLNAHTGRILIVSYCCALCSHEFAVFEDD